MGTKAIEEALDCLENNPTANEAPYARRRARAELEAIRKAATLLCNPPDDLRDPAYVDAWCLLESISEEEP